MAYPADITVWTNESATQGSPGELATLRATVNKLVDTQRLLMAKLDLDAGVTDSDYAALLVNLGVGTAPAKLVT